MKKYLRQLVLAVAICFLFPQQSKGTGNDNPTGVTGEYNGSITTGGSYDPYTGNAKRFVTDLAVTGSLGAYPLKWTRVLNTRGVAGIGFGHGGTWKHSYNWGLWVRPYRPWHYYPDPYVGPDGAVTYPDGRKKELVTDESRMFYWANEGLVEPDDQLVPAPVGNGHFDLILADGGRVEFRHNFNQAPEGTYSLTARRIIDPRGLVTTLERDPATNRLWKIIEPGGRYLEITYTTRSYTIYLNNEYHTISTDVISKVEAFARPSQPTEKVLYHYEEEDRGFIRFYNLMRVDYDDLTHARYTYLPASAPPPHFTSLVPGRIETCDDPRYAGAMGKIEYVYAPYGNIHGPVAVGKIKGEKYPGAPTFVSEVIYPQHDPYTEDPPEFLRTERRADGSTRTFQYSNNGDAELQHYTDFKGQPSFIDWPGAGTVGGYLKTLRDARNNTTSVEKHGLNGAALKMTHPGPGGVFVRFQYTDPNNPYYLASKTDERGKITSYTRYGAGHQNANMIERITYPEGGGFETFIYNNFGQVLEHRMTSGGTEVFTYDLRGLKQTYRPPPTDSNPASLSTVYTYYYGNEDGRTDRADRLKSVTDPRGHTTTYDYNRRGQVIRVTHHDNTFAQSHYNGDGTLAWTADENNPNAGMDGHEHERTRYEYDEYKRVTKVTDPLNHFVRNSYEPWTGHGALSHTTSSVYRTTSHLGRKTDHDYDENFRRLWTKQASETPDQALTQFSYDPVGNLETTTDPRLHVTRFVYDHRNRQTSVTNEALGETTEFRYDDAGNKLRETRPDGVFRTWDYDDMNRVWHAYDWRRDETPPTSNQTTTYFRNHAGNATSITDTKGAVYGFVYDKLNRKESATYPSDAYGQQRTETWLYDYAGNLLQYKNPDNKFRHFHHDNRNRQDHSWWTGNVGPEIVIGYDAASRVEWIETRENEAMVTRVAFSYDEANRKIWEEQTLAGHPTRWVKTDLDEDGRRRNLQILETEPAGPQGNMPVMEPDLAQPEAAQPGGYFIEYDYTARNQVQNISGEDWAFSYSYDPSGNMISRAAAQNGQHISSTLCPTQSYDSRNRPTTWEQTGRDGRFALSNYRYDRASREELTWRWEEANRGERFEYEPTNQLKKASYNIHIDPPPPPTPPPTPPPGQSPTPTPPPGSPPPSPPPGQVTLEEIELEGEFGETLDVTMRTETAGATIFYKIGTTQFLNPTHDGPTPTNGTSVYGGTLHVGVGQHLYFRAIAYRAGMIDSTIVELEVDNTGNPEAPGGGGRIVRYTYTPDMLNRSTVHDTATGLTSYASSALNQYSSVGQVSQTYDKNFNLTGGEGFGGTYNAANRLVTATNGGWEQADFIYDGLGRCVKRTINGVATVLVYDGWKPIAEWDEWGYIEAWNVYGPGADEILLRHRVKLGYIRFHADRRGNVAFLVDNDGRLIEKYSYDAFGKPKVTDWDGGNARSTSHYHHRFLFQGREYITEVGLYDYRNRFYHPGLGRFVQKDPTGFDAGDMNLFRYCGDDPVNRSDPLGLDWAVIDSETQSWALRASEQNRAAHKREGWSFNRIFWNMTERSEWATTVYKENGNVGMSDVYTDGNRRTVIGRDYTGKTSLVYTHTHNHNRTSTVTKSHLSVPDVRVANNKGVTVQVTTPNGDVDRVRPSTATTRDGRWEEGATIERLNSQTGSFDTLDGANADVPRSGPVGEGMAAPSAHEGSVRRTFDAYGSTTAQAALWEASYGNGGWLALQRNTGF